jgi:hypothetical protein
VAPFGVPTNFLMWSNDPVQSNRRAQALSSVVEGCFCHNRDSPGWRTALLDHGAEGRQAHGRRRRYAQQVPSLRQQTRRSLFSPSRRWPGSHQECVLANVGLPIQRPPSSTSKQRMPTNSPKRGPRPARRSSGWPTATCNCRTSLRLPQVCALFALFANFRAVPPGTRSHLLVISSLSERRHCVREVRPPARNRRTEEVVRVLRGRGPVCHGR